MNSEVEDEQREAGPLETFVDSFADQTDLIGVGHLYGAALLKFCSCTPNTNTSSACGRWVERLFWLLVIFGGLGATGWQLYGIFDKYFLFEPSTQISIAFQSPLDFPSVTICNLNPVRKSKLDLYPGMKRFMREQVPVDSKVLQCQLDSMMAQKDLCKSQAATTVKPTTQATTDDNLDNFDISGSGSDPDNSNNYYDQPTSGSNSADFNAFQTYLSILGNMNRTTRIAMGMTAKHLIQQCSFKGKTCSYRDFAMVVSKDYNICWQFNSNQLRNSSLSTPFSGPTFGLNLVLYNQEREYNDGFLDANGFRILIHPFNSMALPKDSGFYVDTGTAANIGLRLVSLSYLPSPFNNPTCENDDRFLSLYNVTYTRDACIATCLERLIAIQCNCTRPAFIDLYPISNRTSLPKCNNTNSLVANCVASLKNKSRTGDLDCESDCPTPCQINEYQSASSSIEWPNDSKWAELLLQLCQSDNVTGDDCKYFMNLQDILYKEDNGYSQDDIKQAKTQLLRENFASVSIYFTELNLETITQQPSYDFTQLGADIGGAAGLWLGMCAFSGVEMIVFVLLGFCATCCSLSRCCRKSSGRKSRENNYNYGNQQAINVYNEK